MLVFEEGAILPSELRWDDCLGEVIGLLLFQYFPVRYWGRERRCFRRRVDVPSFMSVTFMEYVARFLEEVHCVLFVPIRLVRRTNVRLIFPRFA